MSSKRPRPAAFQDVGRHMLTIRSRQCDTCIYRPDSPLDITALERQVADASMPGHFSGWRVCHSHVDAVCAGFHTRPNTPNLSLIHI